MKTVEIVATSANRLDKYLTEQDLDLSRSRIKDYIENGDILVNNEIVKGSYKVKENDVIKITYRDIQEIDLIPEDIPVNIIYQDKDVAVVYKESGMVVHPAKGNKTGTLVHGLLFHIKDLSGINGMYRPGIVHRIDKDTSGLLMVAKSNIAHESLVDQLREKTVTRKYVALVEGVINHNHGKIDAPVGRDPKNRLQMTVTEDGKHAITHFNVLERFDKNTLVECILETGRTHQIRVHFKYIGFPLVGDPQYGYKKTNTENGQYLHAKIVGFNHPVSNEYLEFDSELPDYFKKKIEELKNNISN